MYSLTLHKPIYQFNKHIYLDADNIVIIQIPRTTQQISGVLNGNETLDVGKTRTTKDGYIAYGSLQEFKDAMAKHYSYPALSKESIKPVLNRKDNTCFFIHCNTHVCLGACSDNLKAAMSANQAITAKDLAGFKAPNGPFILGLKGVEEETPIVLSVCKIYSDKVESVSFECLHYSIDKQRRCAYFVQYNIVNEVSFDTLDYRL